VLRGVKIGERIRNLRIASDLTQEELAARADLTKGFISQLERDQTSISVDSLLDILQVLNVKVTDFFSEEPEESIIFREEQRTALTDAGVQSFELLIPGATNRRMEPALVSLAPGQHTVPVPPFHGEEFGFVLQGTLTIRFGTQAFRARTGECFYFEATREHFLENSGKRPAKFLWLTTPPVF
jgi:transcriptional regulator with XRE-family HTH domain